MSSTGDAETVEEEAAKYESGPYTLRSLLSDVHLESSDGGEPFITCVEFWSNNLYIGTSAAEILHYVFIPGDDAAGDDAGTFIEASRRSLPPPENSNATPQGAGVQRILVLPSANKACILCNGSTTFFSLPELTPVLTSAKFANCSWIGGLDENIADDEPAENKDVEVMICQRTKLRLTTIGERVRISRAIDLGGCIVAVRRGNIACVADATSYSLLDVVEQRSIPLLEVTSVQETEPPEQQQTSATQSSSQSTSPNPPGAETRNDSNTDPTAAGTPENAGTAADDGEQQGSQQQRSDAPRASSHLSVPSTDTPSRSPERDARSRDRDGERDSSRRTSQARAAVRKLRPHVVSLTTDEFLLTTGTTADEAGVGLIFDVEGELSPRGTLEFKRYPESLCVDGAGVTNPSSPGGVSGDEEEGFVLAVVDMTSSDKTQKVVEIKRWDLSPDEPANKVNILDIPTAQHSQIEGVAFKPKAGMARAVSEFKFKASEVTKILGRSKISLGGSSSDQDDDNTGNEKPTDPMKKAEADFLDHLNDFSTKILLWNGQRIWWIARTSLLVRVEAALGGALVYAQGGNTIFINRKTVEETLGDLRGLKPKADFDFISLKYARQKGSLLLFMSLMVQIASGSRPPERDMRIAEASLSEGDIDPRVLVSLIPTIREEVFEGEGGIWTNHGIKDIVETFLASFTESAPGNVRKFLGNDLLHLVKRYLLVWRQKKGFESIEDKQEVFSTVDAALLRILLLLDADSPRGPARKASVRSELNSVVDYGVDCFEHAVDLLESHKRLYILSRLYQSRKLSAQVLDTWRRMIEGEQDLGGEFQDGETRVREYLTKIQDASLVEQYGIWLAKRNPRLGVRVFADSSSKIRFQPEKAVEILKEKAPGAVRHFLEHLVFEEKLAAYADDLISYYLDLVTDELENHAEARAQLLQSYTSYRALRAPKPTYIQFATDHGVDAGWWRDRLRLLQLLSGGHGATAAASQYDVSGMLDKIGAWEQELVPEMIILYGRLRRHAEAIRLLTHNLGDFDTAVRYCVLGGLNTYSGSIYSSAAAARDADGKAKTGTEMKPPTREEQAALFATLLDEFLRIEDVSDRATQTSGVLRRFAAWFDAAHVVRAVPDDWSVELVSGFLERALRRGVSERRGVGVERALASVDNLAANAALVDDPRWRRPRVVSADGAEDADGES